MTENINIGGRLHSVATGNVVAGANEIFDDTEQKKQSDINAETLRAGEDYGEETIHEPGPDDLLYKRQQALTTEEKDNVNSNVQDKVYSPSMQSGLGKQYIKKNMSRGLPFNGFVNNVNIENVSMFGVPANIYWDTFRNLFVATRDKIVNPRTTKFYQNWSNSWGYTGLTLSENDRFVFNDDSYVLRNGALVRNNNAEEVNTLTQYMMMQSNTIYTIEYDFDLMGKTITVPAGAVLLFNGGSIDNGVIVFDNHPVFNTTLTKAVFGSNLRVQGSYKTLQQIAFTGNYDDLMDKPVIPTDFLTEAAAREIFATAASLSGYVRVSQFSWANLGEKPTIPTSVSDLEDGSTVVTDNNLDTKMAGYATISTLNERLQGYVTNTMLENLSYDSLQDKPDLSIFATTQSLNDAVGTLQASLADKMPADSAYTKAQINAMLSDAKTVNRTLDMKAVKGIGAVANTWKNTIIADESTLIFENEDTTPDAYIFLDPNTVFGTGGIQVNLLINGAQVDSSDFSKVSVSLYKFKDGVEYYQQPHVGFSIFYKDIAVQAASFFTNNYLPWVAETDFVKIGVLIENTDSNNPLFSASDSISLVIKTKGNTSTDGHLFEVDKQDIYTSAERPLTINTNDGRDVFLGIKDTTTGQVTYIHSGTALNVPYQLTQADYDYLTAELADGFKELVVVPVQPQNGMIDTSVKLSVSNQPNSNV